MQAHARTSSAHMRWAVCIRRVRPAKGSPLVMHASGRALRSQAYTLHCKLALYWGAVQAAV
jgi:hypothetical protein